MRFCQYALLVAAAAAATTLFGSGNVATAVSDRTTGFSTMTPPEVAASFGTGQVSDNEKRFLRYHDKENRGGNKEGDQEEEEGEERKAGVNHFKPTKLDALENQAKHLSVHNLEETKVLKFFNRLAKHKKNNYNFPDVFKQSKYDDLRKLYRTWRYHGRDPFKSL